MHKLGRPLCADHPLTRLDARVKLLCTMALLIMVLSGTGFHFPLVIAAVSVSLCLRLGVQTRVLALRFAEPALIAVMVVILKSFFSGTEVVFSGELLGWTVAGHRDGLLEGLQIAARMGGGVALVALVGFSTSFTDLMGALAWLRVPQGLIEVALFAWRYLFVLFEDAQVVYCAQKNRLGYVGYRRGLRSLGTLAGALVLKAFDNSQMVATAMAQRGYDGSMPLMRHRPFRPVEVVASMMVVAAVGILWKGL